MINPLYAELFNHALDEYLFRCEDTGNHDPELRVLNSVVIHLYGLAFCADDTDSMGELKEAILALRESRLPRRFYLPPRNEGVSDL